MEKRLFTVKKPQDLERCFLIMKELRPHLSREEYQEIYKQSQAMDGYEIVALEVAGEVVAAMGYRFLYDFVRGKHVYIDDLVSSEKARSKGYGAELLEFAEKIAKENDCKVLRLCAVLENTRGIQFYERNGWTRRAFALTKKIES